MCKIRNKFIILYDQTTSKYEEIDIEENGTLVLIKYQVEDSESILATS